MTDDDDDVTEIMMPEQSITIFNDPEEGNSKTFYFFEDQDCVTSKSIYFSKHTCTNED